MNQENLYKIIYLWKNQRKFITRITWILLIIGKNEKSFDSKSYWCWQWSNGGAITKDIGSIFSKG